MEKKLLKTKLALLIIILIVVIMVFLNFLFNQFVITSSAITSTEEFSVDDIEKIDISSLSMDINIIEGEHDKILISHTDSSDETIEKVFVNGDTLYFEQTQKTFLFFTLSFPSTGNGVLTIELPKDLMLDYRINSFGGDVSIEADVPYSDKVDAENSLYINSTSGNITSNMTFNKIDVNSTSSDIKIIADNCTDKISINTVSSDILVQFDEVSSYELNLISVSSGFENTYELQPVSDGKLDININSVSSDLILTDW